MKHEVIRHRHEVKWREPKVREKLQITPLMLRVVLEGGDLADFISLSPDDHVKLFFPTGNEGPDERPPMRDFTPRRYDNAAKTLTIDFAVHEAGPATQWAIDAQVGDVLRMGGPRGSAVVSPTFDWYLLVGDETALPAIGRRLEELPDAKIIVIAAVPDAAEEQDFAVGANHTIDWVHRFPAQNDDPAPLHEALRGLTLPEGDGFIWIAAEAKVARALRDHVRNDRGHPAEWTKAAGYWLKGVADAHEKLGD